MAPPPITAQAIVLRTVPYGDADVIVHLLVQGHGRLGAYARGARKSQKRFGGGLEPFCLLEVELQVRPGRDLCDLRASRPVESFFGIRADLHRMAHAGYATELARELAKEQGPNDDLFNQLLAFLRGADARPVRSWRLRAFELAALSAAGLTPSLEGCSRCGETAEEWFDPEAGGLVCQACRRPSSIRLPSGGARLLRALQTLDGEPPELDDASLPIEGCRVVLRAFIARHVHRELASWEFMRDVGAPL